MASGTLQAKASYSTVNGQYTTASWTNGPNTCLWTAPEDGIYIVWGRFSLNNTSLENRNIYKQLQLIPNGGTSLIGNNCYYYDVNGASLNNPSLFAIQTVSAPYRMTKNGTIRPYVHTGTADVVFDVMIVAVKIA